MQGSQESFQLRDVTSPSERAWLKSMANHAKANMAIAKAHNLPKPVGDKVATACFDMLDFYLHKAPKSRKFRQAVVQRHNDLMQLTKGASSSIHLLEATHARAGDLHRYLKENSAQVGYGNGRDTVLLSVVVIARAEASFCLHVNAILRK